MGLSDIAEGLEVTARQRERGVAAVDETDAPLVDRLAPFEADLPCRAPAAAALVEAYTEGASVGRAAAAAGVSETTAAKTLYLLGEPVDPLSATGRRVLEDWLAGEISRTEARELVGVGPAEFALAAYVATHEPIPEAEAAVAGAMAPGSAADPLAEARSGVDDWL